MIDDNLRNILLKRPMPFITVATCSKDGDPNAAPKLIIKYSEGDIYLVDVPFGRTWKNLKSNPRLSVSFVDSEKLNGYRLKGTVEILDSEEDRKKFHGEVDKLINKMIVNRILEGANRGRGHGNFIAHVPKDFVIFKVKLSEVVEYGLEDIKTRKEKKGKGIFVNRNKENE